MQKMLMVVSCFFYLNVIFLAHASAPEVGDMEDVFGSLAEWMAGRGAAVDKKLKGGYTQHGGANIRGVISTGSFTPGVVLMKMPRDLWIWQNATAFADLMDAKAKLSEGVEACSSLDPKVFTNLIMAAGLAREKAKGDASALKLALKSFPKLQDFESFHPRFAGPELLSDFKALKFSDTIQELQVLDRQLQQCYIGFQSHPSAASLASIAWPDVQEAAMQIRTRAYGNKDLMPDATVIIPLADLLNTAPNSKWNTQWHLSADSFTMTAKAAIGANTELVESYCPQCDNRRMLSLWGIYLENNENRGLNCSAEQASDQALRNAALAVLEATKAPTLTAPRCKAAVFSTKQGPLRCSLARLTWEACSSQWAGKPSTGTSANDVVSFRGLKRSSPRHSRRRRSSVALSLNTAESSLHFKSARKRDKKDTVRPKSPSKRRTYGKTHSLTAAREAALLDQSCRHQVHPDLLGGSLQV
eukprot:gnl/MRDRNA2_/MRDRNA2_98515_c0_seq1.p1 gnl/MRDRNA2_/MRDRNA2_98515_c0~~gnl/MRDRNA2_/MRDRNA2_98515_c0_seq1.p1  ORF type:complete len:472 (-),score=83.88 gnl/MRDRNA2_/MRDRNA2_98515_c0_seq1:34-1449(-)